MAQGLELGGFERAAACRRGSISTRRTRRTRTKKKERPRQPRTRKDGGRRGRRLALGGAIDKIPKTVEGQE